MVERESSTGSPRAGVDSGCDREERQLPGRASVGDDRLHDQAVVGDDRSVEPERLLAVEDPGGVDPRTRGPARVGHGPPDRRGDEHGRERGRRDDVAPARPGGGLDVDVQRVAVPDGGGVLEDLRAATSYSTIGNSRSLEQLEVPVLR